jgi:membrane fusion protein (multidrug efflux system)
MKRWIGLSLLIVAVSAAWYAGDLRGQGGGAAAWAALAKEEADSQPAAANRPVVSVRTVAITQGTLHQTLTAYGTVISQPGEVRVVSVPFECRVMQVLAAAGEPVSAGTALVAVEASPDTQLQWEEAQHGVAAGSKQFQQVRQRFNQHLATNQELYQAQQELQTAQIKLANLKKRGIASPQHLVADLAGIVSQVHAQQGQIVPAGGPLVELAADKRIEVRLGIEPEDVADLKVDQPVALFAADGGAAAAITGHLRLITRRVNPDTRLVDAFVSLPPDAGLLLDQYVRGQLAVASEHALVVPREAVFPEDGGYTLYTVEHEHAVKHTVALGFQDAGRVAVHGDDLKEGQRAVVVGNYELENGMAVTEDAGR